MAQKWNYIKIEDGKIKHAPQNDMNGEITGHSIYGLPFWFDEHPEERIALGWIKHLYLDYKDIEYDRQTQYVSKSIRMIDDYTAEDVYTVKDKTPNMLRKEEMGYDMTDSIIFTGGEWYEI